MFYNYLRNKCNCLNISNFVKQKLENVPRMWVLSEKYKSKWLVSWYLLHRMAGDMSVHGLKSSRVLKVFFLFRNFKYFSLASNSN